MTSLATHTWVSGTSSLTQTFILLPLTSPFKPPAECTSSLLWSSSAIPTPSSGTLQAWDLVNPTTAVGLDQVCWPMSLPNFYARGEGWDDISSLAYAGTVCMSGWTTACTTTFDYSSSRFTQTWCCPSSYQCLSDDGDFGGSRFCVSHLSTSALIWTFDNQRNIIGSYFLKDIPSDKPYPVVRWVLPLAGVEAQTTTSASRSETTTITLSSATSTKSTWPSSTTISTSDSTNLSSGAIVGIAVACTAIAFIGLGAVVLLIVRRRRSPGRENGVASTKGLAGNEIPELKPELDASQPVARQSASPFFATSPYNEISELYGESERRAELEAQAQTR